MLVPIYLGLAEPPTSTRATRRGRTHKRQSGHGRHCRRRPHCRNGRGRRVSAWLAYRYLGLKFLSRSWFNLDATWAVSLILVGTVSLALSIGSGR